MRKVLIILFGVLAVAGCHRDKGAQSIAAIQQQQDSIRRADQQHVLNLQLKAREDSIAIAAMVNSFGSTSATRHHSSYYVVVGSFKNRGNADRYLRAMRSTFGNVQIIRSRGWSFVCVGRRYSSYSSAASALVGVVSQLGGGGSDVGSDEEEEGDEEEVDEEEVDEEEDDTSAAGEEEGDAEADDEEADEGEADEEEEEDEGGDDFSSVEGGGQAWVLGI
ncbi:MAG: SPOR domain-containing protein [Prevotellaceae bacterium]|jgi:hypothetical protein|nr:SPOR domain-containing protein [Prevotellaceae bacterium]